jgi:hypothetical protein
MDDDEKATFYRAQARECLVRAEMLRDPRDAKLHRAFGGQFEQQARALENEKFKTEKPRSPL